MLAIAARRGDGWSSWGGYGIDSDEQMYVMTRDRSARFDDLCVTAGRDPKAVRHSLCAFPPLTPWESVDYFRDMVGRYADIGIDEFVLYYWRRAWRDAARGLRLRAGVHGGPADASMSPIERETARSPVILGGPGVA